MDRDALLLLGAFVLAFLTLNWSDLKLIVAQLKAKMSGKKADDGTTPQE